tara:strand:+ start:2939 stop:3442 length:504 start_codon:yes stop_codon:yes gene_type:complete
MITMKLEGANLFDDAIKDIVKGTGNKKIMIKEVLTPAAKIVSNVMRQMAPKLDTKSFNVYRNGKLYVSIKSGQLKKSISYFSTKASRKQGSIYIGPRFKSGIWKKPEKGGWYFHMVQVGTSLIKPQPFVLQALLSTKQGVSNLIEKGINKRLKKIVSKDGKGIINMN